MKGLDREVEKLNKETGWEVPIHVDAASGGTCILFATSPILMLMMTGCMRHGHAHCPAPWLVPVLIDEESWGG